MQKSIRCDIEIETEYDGDTEVELANDLKVIIINHLQMMVMIIHLIMDILMVQ